MGMMPTSKNFTYAVCRSLHAPLDDHEAARFFQSEKAALAFIKRERAKFIHVRPRANSLWVEWPLPVIPKTPSAAPEKLLSQWKRVEDVTCYDCSFVPEKIVEQGSREINYDQTRWPTCCLHPEWNFDAIENKAWGLIGHVFEGSQPLSLVQALWKAVLDFDALLSNVNRAAFYQSWQMHWHVAKVSDHLRIAKPEAVSGEAVHAEWTVRGLLNAFGREIEEGTVTEVIAVPEHAVAADATAR